MCGRAKMWTQVFWWKYLSIHGSSVLLYSTKKRNANIIENTANVGKRVIPVVNQIAGA